jgi:hypothetical protein
MALSSSASSGRLRLWAGVAPAEESALLASAAQASACMDPVAPECCIQPLGVDGGSGGGYGNRLDGLIRTPARRPALRSGWTLGQQLKAGRRANSGQRIGGCIPGPP